MARKPATLPAPSRALLIRAIRDAFAVLDSVAFVSQPGDTTRPLASLHQCMAAYGIEPAAALACDDAAHAAPDWQAIAMDNARMLQAATEERDELRDAFADRTEALRIAGDALMAAENERDALRRELRLLNLADDGTQKANTPAARVLTLQPANHRTAAARAARDAWKPDASGTAPARSWRLTAAGAWRYVNAEGADIGNAWRNPSGIWTGSPWGGPIENFETAEAAKAHVARHFGDAPASFRVGNGAPCTLAELIAANPTDPDLCAWARTAQIGDRMPDGEGCERIG